VALTYDALFVAGMVFAALTAVSGAFVRTPYGRFGATGWGPALHPQVGWILMELPAPVAYLWFHLHGDRAYEPVRLMFLALWCVHYLNRGWLFPLRMRVRPGAGMSLAVVAIGMGVTTLHGYLNGAWIGGLGANLDAAWLRDPRFVVGIALYVGGFALNVLSDARLRALRERVVPGDYAIPRGGGFRWVSCPNYLGELIAWAGFAIATGSPGGLFVFAISAANLVPRAIETHRWYRDRFPDYPAERRAIVPFVL